MADQDSSASIPPANIPSASGPSTPSMSSSPGAANAIITPASMGSPSTAGTSNQVDTPASASQRRPTDPRNTKPTFWNSQQLVKLYPGSDPEAEPFVVHKDFACYHSPVLKAAFNSNLLEGQTQEYRLEVDGIDKNVVRLLVHWLYFKELDLLQAKKSNEEIVENHKNRTLGLNMVKLWVLAGKLLIPKLQNELINEFDARAKPPLSVGIHIQVMQYVCRNTARDSALRRFTVAQYAASSRKAYILQHRKLFPSDFLLDLVLLLEGALTNKQRLDLQPDHDLSIYKIAED